MERQKAHLNKRINKERAKTPLSNNRQNCFKFSKSKSNNNNKIDPNQRKSPKTIDYDELMEKYGNMTEITFDRSSTKIKNNNKSNNNNYNNKTPLNKSPDRDYLNKNKLNKTEITDNSNINEEKEKKYYSSNNKNNKISEKKYLITKNQKQKTFIPLVRNKNNNVKTKNNIFNIEKNRNKVFNRYNSNNNIYKNKNNNLELDKLKKEINELRIENKKLKSNTITNNNHSNIETIINDKFLLLLNLCRKYAKKFQTLYPLCEDFFTHNDIHNTEIIQELKSTIIQYNNMIFSDKITNLFKIKNNIDTIYEYENTLSPLDISEFEPKLSEFNITDKYKSLINDLKKENNEIKNKLMKYEEQINNSNYKKGKYILNKKNIDDIIDENNNLKKKINELIERENKYLHQNTIIDNLKCQIETLNNSIKYKENTINCLQNTIEKAKINPNLYISDSIKSSIQKDSNKTNNNLNIEEQKNKSHYTYLNEQNENKKNKINRYENNNIISKITISTYDPNLNSNYNNSNIYNSNFVEESKNNINNDSKDIIYKLKENLKNKNNTENDDMNIMTQYKKEDKNRNINISSEDTFQVFSKKSQNEKNKKEQIILKNEIEQLDQEIISLKSKLKHIIKK